MASELIGTIHQYINRCKDTIVEWCKDAAKTVCLPLTGGTINGNVTIKGETTVNDKLHAQGGIFRETTNGRQFQLFHPGIEDTETSLEAKANTGTNILNVDVGWNYANFDGALIGFRSADYPEAAGLLNLYTRTAEHTYALSLNNTGRITWSGPVPEVTDNSSHLATTAWVNNYMNQMANGTLGSTATGNARYIKFPNGKLICSGLLWNVYSGTRISFPVPFVGMEPHVVISRHWGGNNTNPEAGATWAVGSAPLQVYDTSTTVSSSNKTYTGFRVGVYTHNSTDMTQYINKQQTIYGMWIAFGEWK